MADTTVRTARLADAGAITKIYNHYIKTSTATFETEPVAVDTIEQRMRAVRAERLPWLVAAEDDACLGYAYATQWKDRHAYRFSVESTVYLAPEAAGRGLGRALYEALFRALEDADVHVVVGGITLPNPASVALHEKLGMVKVAHFNEIGFKFGQWVDVGYWQRCLGGGDDD